MAEPRIELLAGTKTPHTFNLTDASGAAYDLTQHGGYVVRIYVHDDEQDTDGTNQVDGATMTQDTPAGGVVSYIFDATDTGISAAEFKGSVVIRATANDGSRDLAQPAGRIIIRRNRYF